MPLFGEGLSVRVSGQAQSATRAIESVQDQLRGLARSAFQTSGALTALNERTDEASDDMRSLSITSNRAASGIRQVGTRAGATSGLVTGLSTSILGLRVSIAGMGVPLFGVLIPGLIALSSTLVPLVAVVGTLTAGLGALAGAFGTVIGTGIIAFGAKRAKQNRQRLKQIRARIKALKELQQGTATLTAAQELQLEKLQEQEERLEEQTDVMGGLASAMSDLRKEIQPIIVAFGQQFIPLIEDAIEGIPELIANMLQAAGGMDMFRRAIRDFGETAFNVLPIITRELSILAMQALPIVRDFGQWLLNNGRQIFMGMLQTTRELAPVFMNFINSVVNAILEINRLGTNVLQVLIPAFSGFFSVLEDILQAMQGDRDLVTLLQGWVNSAISWVQGPGLSLVEDIVTGIVDVLSRVFSTVDLTNAVTSFMGSLASALQNISGDDIQGTVDALGGVLSDIVGGLITIVESDEAGALGTQLSRLAGTTMGILMDEFIKAARSDQFAQDIAVLSTAIAQGLIEGVKIALANALAQIEVADLLRLAQMGQPQNIVQAISGRISSSIAEASQRRPRQEQAPITARDVAFGQTQARGQNEVILRVEGDNPLANFIRQMANQQFREKERRNMRNNGIGG